MLASLLFASALASSPVPQARPAQVADVGASALVRPEPRAQAVSAGAPDFHIRGKAVPDGYGVRLMDWNHDGILDALGLERDGFTVRYGDGHGNFDVVPRPARSVLPADLDGDGRLEGVTPALISDPDSPINFSFAFQALSVGPEMFPGEVLWTSRLLASDPFFFTLEARIVAAVDLDGNGLVDLLAAEERDQVLELVLFRDLAIGDDTEGSVVATLQVGLDSIFRLGDMDRDGALDLVTAEENSFLILPGEGGGGFGEPRRVPHPADAPRSIDLADVDQDGRLDIVYHRSRHPSATMVLLQVQGGSFSAPLLGPRGDFTTPVVADVDADGFPDLVSARRLHLGDGRGGFVDASDRLPDLIGFDFSAIREGSRSVATDLDGDGDVDLFLAGHESVLFQDSTGRFSPGTSEFGLFPGALGDLNGDGFVDVIDGGQGVLLADAAGDYTLLPDSFPPGAPRFNDSRWRLLDTDADGDLDLVIDRQGRILSNDGEGRFSSTGLGCMSVSSEWPVQAAVMADFNADGYLDLFQVRSTQSFPPLRYVPLIDHLFLGDAQGCLIPADFPEVPTIGLAVAAGDIDADGDVDLVVGSGHVYRNLGAGGWAVERNPSHPFEAAHAVALADLDGDGDLDAYFGTGIGFASDFVARNDGGGHFSAATGTETSHGASVQVGDVDGDGADELLVSVQRRLGSVSFRHQELYRATPTGLETVPMTSRTEVDLALLADLEGDGDLDVVSRPFVLRNRSFSLARTKTPRVGRPLSLELRGAPHSPYELALATGLRRRTRGGIAAGVLRRDQVFAARRGVLDEDGRATLEFDVPANPRLAGVTVYAQARTLPSRRWGEVEVLSFLGD